MERFFNIENPVWRFMGKVFDMAVLNFLWIICSLPVFTIGASTTALIDTMRKLANDQEGYIIRQFFSVFRHKFKVCTKVWIAECVIGTALFVDVLWYYQFQRGFGVVIFTIVVLLATLYLMVLIYTYPILARYDRSIKQMAGMVFVMAIGNIGWTILLLISMVCVIAVGVFVSAPILAFAPGIIGYIHSKILNWIMENTNEKEASPLSI